MSGSSNLNPNPKRRGARLPPGGRQAWSIKVPTDLAKEIDELAARSAMSRSEYLIDLMRVAADQGWVKEDEVPKFRVTKE